MNELPKVLIVDDNINNIYVIEGLLEKLELQTVRALSGPEAIDLTDQQEFALILMDVSMPGMDGFETVEIIKSRHENKMLNVIFVTALFDEPYYKIKSIRTGAVDFITKPVIPELLVGKVNIFLNIYKQHKSLEQEIINRIGAQEELVRARQHAEEAAKAKQEFLSTMSHEIRTPLNAIINTTHLLLEEQPRQDQLDNMNILKFSAQGLLQLINEILDFSRIDSGKIEFESLDFDLRALASNIFSTLEHDALMKGLSLEINIDKDVPPVLNGDAARLSQVLLNLVGNAIKFTRKGRVTLTVNAGNAGRNEVELMFNVTDTGIGIPEEQQQRIFDSFAQASSSTTRTYGGTGLGLAITRMLIELQGGRLILNSRVNEGSSFAFNLKFRPGNSPELIETVKYTTGYPSLKGLKILVAEDNLINQKLVSKILNKWEASADVAENGMIAVQKVMENRYHLVLMDLHMPEMNGYEASMKIRKMKGSYYHNLPIIAVTATAFAEERSKITSFGMNGVLIKPFTPPELYEKISHYHKTAS
jgi:two-component system, sensor histidine kinase